MLPLRMYAKPMSNTTINVTTQYLYMCFYDVCVTYGSQTSAGCMAWTWPVNSYLLQFHSRYKAENDDYSVILLKSIADRLAEVNAINTFCICENKLASVPILADFTQYTCMRLTWPHPLKIW